MPEPVPPSSAPDNSAGLESVHTLSFPILLKQLGVSLLVSTYQAGKLIVVRADGDTLNTHFRNFRSPMGLAEQDGRLVIGTKDRVWDFRNQPAVAAKLEPPGQHDACYLPRSIHVTGDIRVHEIAWAGRELWIVNTRFSCLCTLDGENSFRPRWHPSFITDLLPEDRCHLNGLGVRDELPRYATCLGQCDTPGGWRANKASGGCLIDVMSGEVLIEGLSMPHSPRWYQDRLWLLESGQGSILWIDEWSGTRQLVATLPGFTRGLDFVGPYAFIGLSQVRETALFSGIPITERQKERICGVWVIDVRSGKTVAYLQFKTGVQEVFAVQVLKGIRYPDVIPDDEDVIGNSFVLPG